MGEKEGENRMTLSLGSWGHFLREWKGPVGEVVMVGFVRINCCQLWATVFVIGDGEV